MNEELQYQINKHVHKNDILFHLGDFSFAGGSPRFFREFINCKEIHVILGNHDKFRQKDIDCFSSVNDYVELNIGKDKFCMSHYPMLVWNKHHHGSYMLHGHCHGSLYNYGNSIYNRRVLDVGVDLAYKLTGDYRPFKLTEIIDILKDKPIQFIDHHNKKTND
jgi:calcineurin-like phosphoesterase family protein